MLNLPIKILKTVQIETQTITITIDDIDLLVADWDARAKVTSRHLVIITNCRDIDVSNSVTQFLRFNGSIANDYSYQRLSGVDAADSAGRTEGANAINLPPIPGASNENVWGGSEVLIPDAFSAAKYKSVLALGGPSEFAIEAVAGDWEQVAAITSVTIVMGVADEMVVGSTVSIGVVDERDLVEEWISAGVGTPVFDNIPQGEGDLVMVASARSSQAAIEDELLHYINDDNTAFPTIELLGIGAGRTSGAANGEIAIIPGQTATANVFGALVINYSQYVKDNQPHFFSLSGYHEMSGPTAQVRLMSGRRANIEPINKIELAPTLGVNLLAASLVSLYRVPKRIIKRVIVPVGGQAIITLANIPQNFEALILHVYARTNEAAVDDEIAITIDADAVAANYDWQEITGAGGVVAALRNLASQQLMYVPGDTEGAYEFGGGTALFPGYAKTDRHGQQENRIAISSHRHESLDAITTIVLAPVTGALFLEGTVVELEGILKREGLPPDEGMQIGV